MLTSGTARWKSSSLLSTALSRARTFTPYLQLSISETKADPTGRRWLRTRLIPTQPGCPWRVRPITSKLRNTGICFHCFLPL